MTAIEELARKMWNPFNACAVLSLILGTVSLFSPGPNRTLIVSLFALCLIYLLVVIVGRVAAWYSGRTGVKVFFNRDAAPAKYRVPATLHLCATPNSRLEVVGRTCISWLCGDERDVEMDDTISRQHKSERQELLLTAIRSGGSVHFSIQNPLLQFPMFGASDQDRLRKHAEASIGAYEDARQKLDAEQQSQLTLSIINEVVENSMVRLLHDDHVARTVLDLSAQFKASQGVVSKPLLVVETGKADGQAFLKEEFDYIRKSAMPYEQFIEKGRELLEVAHKTIKDFKHYSKTRGDTSTALAVNAAHHFMAECAGGTVIPSPVSVQFLITNECTTKCVMCDHFKLHAPGNELSEGEQLQVLRMIKELGTHNVIISGGEPLASGNLSAVLQAGKKLGLGIGLLTNGICKDGKSVTKEVARQITSNCEWVQISIDSLNPETYKNIRGGHHLPAALESVQRLSEAQCRRLEVCVTIQQENIHEIPEMPKAIAQELPSGVDVRFKFAHGPVNGRNFLPSVEQVTTLSRKLASSDGPFNWGYLQEMMGDRHFDLDCLARGLPLKAKMREYNLRGYRCYALRLTCVVDATGEVYPCCFLFDDNRAASAIRPLYLLGPLRSPATGTVPNSGNPLAQIWRSNENLKAFRTACLPIHEEACSACIRHFYQNEMINWLWKTFDAGRLYGVADAVASLANAEEARNIWV